TFTCYNKIIESGGLSTVEEKQSKFSRGLLLFFIGATALFFMNSWGRKPHRRLITGRKQQAVSITAPNRRITRGLMLTV
ncbi:hypothetical protein MMB69_27065, partial [Priestia sp. P5]|nr:hypothetical protein [Priestia sp. P5]